MRLQSRLRGTVAEIIAFNVITVVVTAVVVFVVVVVVPQTGIEGGWRRRGGFAFGRRQKFGDLLEGVSIEKRR